MNLQILEYLHTKKIHEVGSNYIWWSAVLIDSLHKKDENYYPQVFLKECKYTKKDN